MKSIQITLHVTDKVQVTIDELKPDFELQRTEFEDVTLRLHYTDKQIVNGLVHAIKNALMKHWKII